jgi:hypothetical protein
MTDSPKKVSWEQLAKEIKLQHLEKRRKAFNAAKRARKAEAKN